MSPADDAPGSSGPDDAGDPDVALLTSPLRQGTVARVFVIGGPLGLAVAICLSLWVSYLHVRHTVTVHVEPQWEAGQSLAVRAQLSPEASVVDVAGASGTLWVEQGRARIDLPPLQPTPRDGVLQTTFEVPTLSPGPAAFHVRLEAPTMEPREEVVDVEVTQQAPTLVGEPMVAGSTLQYGDDSDPQPEGLRIDVIPGGRLLSEFENTLWVRVAAPDGTPHVGPVQVALADGEFGGVRGDPEEPVVVFAGHTNVAGLAKAEGRLTSEVLRVQVQVLAGEGDDPKAVKHRRRVRLVSFAGAVRVLADPTLQAPGGAVELTAEALRPKHPVFVDVHDVRGRFIDTVSPPFAGREAPRAWTLPAGASGILQLEAYHFTHAPGESTAVTRIHATNDPPRKALASLLAAHHAGLDVARVDRTYDREIEKAYLDRLAKLDLPAGQAAQVHAFLLQTIPLRVHGPPLRLATRERDLAAMAKTQRRWTIGLRFFLLGGGGLFLLAMTLTMARTHAAAAAATMAELERIGSMDESLDAAREVARARRAALWRGLAVVAVMAAGLVLTTVMLESLLWVF